MGGVLLGGFVTVIQSVCSCTHLIAWMFCLKLDFLSPLRLTEERVLLCEFCLTGILSPVMYLLDLFSLVSLAMKIINPWC